MSTKQDLTKKILKKMPKEEYEKIKELLNGIPSYSASECVVLNDKARAVMTNEAAEAVKLYFDILKLDYKNDENLMDSPFRKASMDVNELLIGRYTKPPRIEAFPAGHYHVEQYVISDDETQEALDTLYFRLDEIEKEFYSDETYVLLANKLLTEVNLILEQIDAIEAKSGIYKPSITSMVVKNTDVNCICSHHFISFVSTDDKESCARISYIPKKGCNKALLGISKLQRVMDWFGRRPQLQEMLNWQVQSFLKLILRSSDVMVSFHNIVHYCEKTRGVESHCGNTSTVELGGRFLQIENRNMAFDISK